MKGKGMWREGMWRGKVCEGEGVWREVCEGRVCEGRGEGVWKGDVWKVWWTQSRIRRGKAIPSKWFHCVFHFSWLSCHSIMSCISKLTRTLFSLGTSSNCTCTHTWWSHTKPHPLTNISIKLPQGRAKLIFRLYSWNGGPTRWEHCLLTKTKKEDRNSWSNTFYSQEPCIVHLSGDPPHLPLSHPFCSCRTLLQRPCQKWHLEAGPKCVNPSYRDNLPFDKDLDGIGHELPRHLQNIMR